MISARVSLDGSRTNSTKSTPIAVANLSRLERLMFASPLSTAAIIRRLIPDASASAVWLRPEASLKRRRFPETWANTSARS
ncbi:hypothetical protein D3C78_1886150 [compost metagenome]